MSKAQGDVFSLQVLFYFWVCLDNVHWTSPDYISSYITVANINFYYYIIQQRGNPVTVDQRD